MVNLDDTLQGKSDEAKQLLSANTNEMVAGGGFGLPWFVGKSRISLLWIRRKHILIGLQKQPTRKAKKKNSSGSIILLS